jgi:hypothetical protein
MRSRLFLFLLYGTISVWAQVKTFLAADVENDFLNFRGRGTDCYYSGGNTLLVGRELLRANFHALALSITQQTFTPSDLQATKASELDYPYAGLLFGTVHALFVSPVSRWRLCNRVSIGWSGPRSGVASWQRTVHRIIRDEQPQGWSLIHPTASLLQFKTQVFIPAISLQKWNIELLQEGEGGNHFNRLQSGVLIYYGNLPPSFSLMATHTSRSSPATIPLTSHYTASFYFLSQVGWVIRNRILEESSYKLTTTCSQNPDEFLNRATYMISGGVSFANQKRGIYFTQQWQNSELDLLPSHSFGAIRLFFIIAR